MGSLDSLTTFFGWCCVLNLSVLMFATTSLFALQDMMIRIHSNFFSLREDDLRRAYFDYLARYKIAIFIFNLAPYGALKLMA